MYIRIATLILAMSVFVACGTDQNNGPCSAVAGGTGTPSLTFTSVPALGSTAPLEGQALHVVSKNYVVVVYIHVNGGWWIKPTFADPLTSINCNGTWQTDITTGGDDAQADTITAFVIPVTYSPPLLDGNSELPPDLTQNAVATQTATR